MKSNFENCGYYTDGECNICGMGISGEDTFCRLCKDNPNCYYKQLKYKEQECEKLKESLKVWKYSDVQHIFKINKYEQTLTEIKEIAKENIRIADLEGLNGVYRRGLATQILQKISEVENDR